MTDYPSAAHRVLQFTQGIVDRFPGRLNGSDACRQAGLAIAESLDGIADAGSVRRQEFSCHPSSMLRYFPLLVAFYWSATVFEFIGLPALTWIGFGLLLAGLALFTCQFVYCLPIFDFLFPKAQCANISATLEPVEPATQQVIICGHHDAGYVFHLMDRFPRHYPLICGLNIAAQLAGMLLALLGCLIPAWLPGIAIASAVLGIFVLPSLWFTTKAISPGAGDNMVAVALARETLASFASRKANPISALRRTRLIFLSADAEECGFRGSRAWVAAHRAELAALPTQALCLDTIYNPDQLVFIDRDRNLLRRLSAEMAGDLVALATKLGIGASIGRIPFGGGGTDAGTFAEIGLKATCLLAFELDVTKIQADLAYHTPRDTVEAINPRAVEQCLEVMQNYIELLDRDGMAPVSR